MAKIKSILLIIQTIIMPAIRARRERKNDILCNIISLPMK